MKVLRLLGEGLIFREGKNEAVAGGRSFLRSCVGDDGEVEGEELGMHDFVAQADAETEAVCCGLKAGNGIRRERLRHFGEGRGNRFLLSGIDCGMRGWGRERGASEAERGLAREAYILADQPRGVRDELNLFCFGMEVLSDLESDGQDDMILVAEVHERTEGQALGRRILERAGGDALGEGPLDIGWFAGVTGIDPVDVPSGGDIEFEPAGEGLARVKLSGWNEKFDGEVLGDGGVLRARRRGDNQHATSNEQGEYGGNWMSFSD